jgi:hypothetical protein
MKKVNNYFSAAFLSMVFMSAGYAQISGNMNANTQEQSAPKKLTDPSMSQRLQSDLTGRNPLIGDSQVTWMDAGNGYVGTYSTNNVNYMTNYDKDGTYMGSYRKAQWDTEVPSSIRTSFEQSSYKGQNVTGYWESADPAMKGYYLEIDNGKGRTSKVWADDKGKFSTAQPSTYKPKQ